MNKHLIRLVAFLVVPCLIADPATAVAFTNTPFLHTEQIVLREGVLQCFAEEALSARLRFGGLQVISAFRPHGLHSLFNGTQRSSTTSRKSTQRKLIQWTVLLSILDLTTRFIAHRFLLPETPSTVFAHPRLLEFVNTTHSVTWIWRILFIVASGYFIARIKPVTDKVPKIKQVIKALPPWTTALFLAAWIDNGVEILFRSGLTDWIHIYVITNLADCYLLIFMIRSAWTVRSILKSNPTRWEGTEMPGNIEASKRGPTPAAEPQHRSNPVKSLGQWVAYVRLLITVKIFSYISNEEFYQWAEDRLATLGRRSLGQWDAKAFEAFRLARLEKMGGFEKGFLLKWELEKNEKNEFTGRMILLPKPKLVRDKTIDSRLDEISAYEKAHGVTVKLEKDWYSVVEGRWQWLQALRHKLMEETHELGDDLSNQEAFFTQAANLVQAMQRLRDFTQGTSAAAPETARSSVRTISGSVWRYFSREERIRRKLLRALKRVNFFEREIGKMSLPDNFPLTHDDIRAAAQRFYTFVQEASIDFSNPFFEAIASVDPVGRYLQIHPELVKNLVVHMSIWFHEAIHLSERHEAVLRYSLSLRKKLDTVPLDSLKDKGFSEMAAEYLQIIWQMENESAYAQIAFLNARAGAERLSLKDYMKDLSEFIDFRLLGLVYLDILGRAFEKEMQQAKAYRPDKITSEFEDLRLSALMSDDSRPLLAALARADGLEVPQDIQEFYDQFFEDSGFRDFITAWARKKILSFKAPSAQFAAAPEQKRDGFGVLEVIVWATALTGLIIGVYLLAHPGILHHAISVLHQGWSVLATVSAVAAKKSLVPILTGAIFFLMAHAGTAAAMQPAEIAEPEDSLEELPVNPLTKLLAARSLGKWQINENILRAFRVLPDDPKAVGWLLRWADNNDAAFNQIARCAVVSLIHENPEIRFAAARLLLQLAKMYGNRMVQDQEGKTTIGIASLVRKVVVWVALPWESNGFYITLGFQTIYGHEAGILPPDQREKFGQKLLDKWFELIPREQVIPVAEQLNGLKHYPIVGRLQRRILDHFLKEMASLHPLQGDPIFEGQRAVGRAIIRNYKQPSRRFDQAA